jgi:hypothetical protein
LIKGPTKYYPPDVLGKYNFHSVSNLRPYFNHEDCERCVLNDEDIYFVGYITQHHLSYLGWIQVIKRGLIMKTTIDTWLDILHNIKSPL